MPAPPGADLPPTGAILDGPYWPERVRVVRAAPRGAGRCLIQAVTLDGQATLITRILNNRDLARVTVDLEAERPTLQGDPLGFRLAAEATRIRLAYTYDPQFAASVARIDPLPHQLEAVYYYMLPQPRLRFLLADDPGAGKTIMAGLLLKELKLRGALTRTLVVAPANLVPQWQREMQEKFGERFDVVDRGALNAYGSRAWEIGDQCVVSIDFAWRSDVMEGLARATRWDLVIVDEAHKMAAYRRGEKIQRTRRYRLGELLTEQTEHLLLMTATPHKGDPENFRLLLQLLDPDLFANTGILARAVRRQDKTTTSALSTCFLRRLKEDMTDFDGRPLFPPRHVHTLGLALTPPEQALYEAVTRYVSETFNRALVEDNRNVSFALIILQRRLASSVRAIRCSLENRRDRLAGLRDEVRANPQLLEAARRGESPWGALPEDAPESARWEAEARALRYTVARNLDELEAEIQQVDALARQALTVEQTGPERKLDELRRVMEELDVFHSGEKLLVFTEAKDTLDYLLEHLGTWGLAVTHIDGSMPPPARYAAEEHFRDPQGAQVMVATEAAGEGINLQFCHLMINYDLPWNPTRLEQRMGRVHRYGQQYEVHIYNLVATSTREGMVFHALLDKLERMREGLGADRVFDVVDQLLQGVSLERLLRDALANRLTFAQVRERVLSHLTAAQDTQDQERRLQAATLSGLATRYVDLSRLRADRRRAAEMRLVPAYIRAFFTQALEALAPGRLERRDDGFWRLSYVPAALREAPEALRRRFGAAEESYAALTFDKADLQRHRRLTFVGPGHPLFEAVLYHVLERYGPDLTQGAVLRDPSGETSGLIWLLAGSVEDGLGRVVGKRLFALHQPADRATWRPVSPARLLDFEPPVEPLPLTPAHRAALQGAEQVVDWSLDQVLDPYLQELAARRRQETDVIRDYLRRSFNVLIARAQGRLMRYERKGRQGTDMALKVQEERRHLDDLRRRQARRLDETAHAAVLALGAPEVLGVAGIVPAPASPPVARGGPDMRRDDQVEAVAMIHAAAYERHRGWRPEDVSAEDRGYDLLSHGPAEQARYIEVKGRAGVGAVELSENEWLKAEQLGADYWLYIVVDALQAPDLYVVQDPAHRLPREELIQRVRYRVKHSGWRQVAESTVQYNVSSELSSGQGSVEHL
jgi:superfamily II DNA or RNA helicase